jgi:hypothetical protein
LRLQVTSAIDQEELMDNRALLMGIGLGSALAYVLDPNAGGRRRAMARDKLIRAGHVASRALDATACDMANRAKGIVAATTGRFRDRDVDDVTLVERARAKLGRASSHPHAIDVHAADGVVTLRGPILASELPRLLATIASVRGVREVMNELDVHEAADNVPSLQGQGRLAGSSVDLLQSRWAPATRALVGIGAMAATSAAALAYARR